MQKIMAEGDSARTPETIRVRPVLTLPRSEGRAVEPDVASESDGGERGRSGAGKQSKEEKRNAELLLRGKETLRKRAIKKAEAEAVAAASEPKPKSESTESTPTGTKAVEGVPDLKDLPNLPDYSDGEQSEAGSGLLARSAFVALETAALVPRAVGKTMPWFDWIGRKLNSWGDSMLKKADLPFPIGPLAELTAGGMDWISEKILGKDSLADQLKKEKEEKQKAMDKAIKQLSDDRAKMEKKQDDAAKKEEKKKENERKKEEKKKAAEAKERKKLRKLGHSKDEIDAIMAGREDEDDEEEDDEDDEGKTEEPKTEEPKTEEPSAAA